MPDVTIPDTPMTRTEQYLAAANGQSVTLPTPMTREEIYLNEIATKMQGGGSGVTVEPLTVAENGTYTAPSGKAYSPVTVAVPEIGPIWSEFTATASASNAQSVFDLIFPTAQPGEAFIAICQKSEEDFLDNQLVYGIFSKRYNSPNNIALFLRYRDGSHDAKSVIGGLDVYDLSVSVGDKYIICEVT